MVESPKNKQGLTTEDYRGSKSTLCMGCGHDSITGQIIAALYEANTDPYKIVKFSGIGCSSKTPAYFLKPSQGFNSVHGRMPSVATGSLVANATLKGIAVSGDGDSANIGLGQFCHILRRNVPLVYIIENNGVYGLTKGQFSATADKGSKLKTGAENTSTPIDLCALAIQMGCSFVARGFAGDMPQLLTLIKAAISHNGTAVLDVLSPCVSFNNHDESTKSYKWAKEHEQVLHGMDFVPFQSPIIAQLKEGEMKTINLHDGAQIILKRLGKNHDPTDKSSAIALLNEAHEKGEFLTGLFYVNGDSQNLRETLKLSETPLAKLTEKELRPTKEQWIDIMGKF